MSYTAIEMENVPAINTLDAQELHERLSPQEQLAMFTIGQVIQHRHYSYRGVIIDVDPNFQGSDEWYQENAGSNSPKEAPWYHVIVDEEDAVTYVAERNLMADADDSPVEHPMLDDFFSGYGDGRYQPRACMN